MNRNLSQHQELSLLDDGTTLRKLKFNYEKNKESDQTVNIDKAATNFDYEKCKDEYWNPEKFSFLYGTELWNQSTAAQRVKLNQIYWLAYYSQIISAEIATIFYNQTAAAGLYGYEDFRLVCDTLDLESAQERAHINAFKKVSEDFEEKIFGERILTYPMRGPYATTMIHSDQTRISSFWRTMQLKAYALLSSGNAFVACQYFTVRGLRTLNGKIVQHQLSRYYTSHADRDNAPEPSKISFYHFVDESFHFNSSTVISHDVIKSLRPPTKFESRVANMTLMGCQKDHYHFSTAINGIFWHDPALFAPVYRILRSSIFGMDDREAKAMIWKCFCEESQGMIESEKTHRDAIESYKSYLSDFPYVSKANHEMSYISKNDLAKHLATNRQAYRRQYSGEPTWN